MTDTTRKTRSFTFGGGVPAYLRRSTTQPQNAKTELAKAAERINRTKARTIYHTDALAPCPHRIRAN